MRHWLLWICLLLSNALAASELAPPVVLPDGSMQGVVSVGAAGITESVAAIQSRQNYRDRNGIPAAPRRSREHELYRQPVSPPNALAVATWPPLPEGMSPMSPGRAPQVVGPPNFLAATLADTSAFPPDTMGAVGPTQFIAALNGRIRSFNKSTGVADGALNVSSDAFFATVMSSNPGTFTTDPRIRFDRLSNRWFILMIDVPAGTGAIANRVMIAVSNAATITGAANFTFFQFQLSGTLFADYPTLGIDQNALYIGANMFTLAGAYSRADLAVVRKSSILGPGPIAVTLFSSVGNTSGGLFTPQGVDNYDPAATLGYVIGVDAVAFNLLQMRRVSTPGATPTLSANLSISVPSTSTPLPVTAPGSAVPVDGLDDRLYAAHARNGRLWTAHNIAVTNAGVGATTGAGRRTATRWYELDNLNTAPTLRQSGTVFDSAASNPRAYWIPSVMVSGQGHAALGFSTASPVNSIDAATTGRLATDTLGVTQGTPERYTNSTSNYAPPGDGGNPRRWGDYSYVSLDPCDDMTMWTVQQFTNAANSYGVQAVRLRAPPPTLASCASPTTINTGSNNVLLNLSGSGLYDTDVSAGACRTRLAAAISGSGVTVNSISFNSPTSVSLNLSVAAGAASGLRSITLTNPDGQSASTANCLSIATAGTTVAAITRSGGNPVCTGDMVNWAVSLNGSVAGLGLSNFALVGGTGASLSGISGGGANYSLSANVGSAAATLGLNLVNASGVSPTISGLPFTGQTYTVNARPQVNALSPPAICSGQFANIVPTSTPAGATFSWTASNTAGSVSGFSSGSGSGISQALSGSGSVTYAVSATLSSCGSANPTNIVQSVSNPAITTTSLPSGAVGQVYNATLASSGLIGAPSYTVTGGSLPTSLTLSPSGTLSGTPSAAGTFNFTVSLSDGAASCSATRAYSVTIAGDAVFSDGFE